MAERAARRQFITHLATEAVERRAGEHTASAELKKEYGEAVTADTITKSLQGELRNAPWFTEEDVTDVLAARAGLLGLTTQDVHKAMAEVQQHIALRSDVEVRDLYRKDLAAATRGGKLWKIFQWDWKKIIGLRVSESLAMIGLGQASEMRATRQDYASQRRDIDTHKPLRRKQLQELPDEEREHAIRNSYYYVEELVDASFEKQAMRRKLARYAELGGEPLQNLLGQFHDGTIDVEQFKSHINLQMGIRNIVKQMDTHEGVYMPSETDHSGFEHVDITDQYVEEAVRRHLAYVLRSEITHLALAEQVELMRARPVYNDGTAHGIRHQIKRFGGRVMFSGTLWSIVLRSGARLGIAGATAGSLLEGSTGIAVAAGLGAAGAAVREVLNESRRIALRRIDMAVGVERVPEDAVRSTADITEELGDLAQAVRAAADAARIIQAVENLYKVVADTQVRLNPPNYNPKIEPQDYVAFGKHNRFKAQTQLINNFGDAIELIDQTLEQLPPALAAHTRTRMREIGQQALQEHINREQKVYNRLHSTGLERIGRYVKAMSVGAASAGGAAVAYGGISWLYHKVLGEAPVGTDFSLQAVSEGSPLQAEFELDGEKIQCVLRPDNMLQFLYQEDGRVFNYIRLPEGIDLTQVRVTVGEHGGLITVSDAHSNDVVAQVMAHVRAVEPGEFVQAGPPRLGEAQPNLLPGLPCEASTARGVFRISLDETGVMQVFQMVDNTPVAISEAIDAFTTVLKYTLRMYDDLSQFTVTHETIGEGAVAQDVLVVRSVYQPDRVVAKFTLGDGALPEPTAKPSGLGRFTHFREPRVESAPAAPAGQAEPQLTRVHLAEYHPVRVEDLAMPEGEKFLDLSLVPPNYRALIATDIGSIVGAESLAQPSTRLGWKGEMRRSLQYWPEAQGDRVGESVRDHAGRIRAEAVKIQAEERLHFLRSVLTPEYVTRAQGLMVRVQQMIDQASLSPKQIQVFIQDEVADRMIEYHRELHMLRAELYGERSGHVLRDVMQPLDSTGVLDTFDNFFTQFVGGRQLERMYQAVLQGGQGYLAQLRTEFDIHAQDLNSTDARRQLDYANDYNNLVEFEASFRSGIPQYEDESQDENTMSIVIGDGAEFQAFHQEIQELGNRIFSARLGMDLQQVFSKPAVREYVFDALTRADVMQINAKTGEITILQPDVIEALIDELRQVIQYFGLEAGEYSKAMSRLGWLGPLDSFRAKQKARIDFTIADVIRLSGPGRHGRTVPRKQFADLDPESFLPIEEIMRKDLEEIAKTGIQPAEYSSAPASTVTASGTPPLPVAWPGARPVAPASVPGAPLSVRPRSPAPRPDLSAGNPFLDAALKADAAAPTPPLRAPAPLPPRPAAPPARRGSVPPFPRRAEPPAPTAPTARPEDSIPGIRTEPDDLDLGDLFSDLEPGEDEKF